LPIRKRFERISKKIAACVRIRFTVALLYVNAVRIQREFNHSQPSQPTTVNTMKVKTNVKAGPTPIYRSINDTGFSSR